VLRALTVGMLVLALSTAGASARTGGGSASAFVTVDRPPQVVSVDLSSGRVVARIRVPDGPRDVVSYGARHLLVVSPKAHAVTLVDSFEERVVKVWRDFGRPVAVATNGAYAYVIDAGRSELAIIDLATERVRGRIAVRPQPRDVAVGDAALVTHARHSANLTVAELSWGRDRVLRLRHFPAGGAADEISRAADTAYAYVTYSRSGTIGALDWGTEELRWQRRVGAEVSNIAVDPYFSRRLWVTDRETGVVLALSSENGRILRRLGGCPGAGAVTVVGSAWVVAACRQAHALGIWSRRNRTRKLVDVGAGHGVAEAVLP
jgi:hypothetical protein